MDIKMVFEGFTPDEMKLLEQVNEVMVGQPFKVCMTVLTTLIFIGIEDESGDSDATFDDNIKMLTEALQQTRKTKTVVGAVRH